MARMNAQTPLPSVYRLATFVAEAVVLAVWMATWMAAPAAAEASLGAAETLVGLLACYFALVFAAALGLAIRRQEPRLPMMGNAGLFATFRFVKFKSWFLLAIWLLFLGLIVKLPSGSRGDLLPLVHSLILTVVSAFFLFCLFVTMPTGGAPPSWRKFAPAAEDGWAGPLRELAERVGVARSSYVLRAGDGSDARAPGPAAYRMTGRQAEFFFDHDFMAGLSPRERLAVFAHELAHHRLDHSRRSRRAALVVNFTGVAVFATWLLLLTGDDAKFLNALAPATFLAWLTCLLLGPLYLAHLRDQERHANDLALRMTHDAEAFESAMKKLADHMRVTPFAAAPQRPPKWLHGMFDAHPTLEETLAQAAAWGRREKKTRNFSNLAIFFCRKIG